MRAPLPLQTRAPASRRWLGFTLVEMSVAMSASVIIIGALWMSIGTLQQSLQGTTTKAEAQSDQRRLTDYLSRDLRRAVAVAATDASGERYDIEGAATVTVADRESIILWLPAYYVSDTRGEQTYD